MKSFRNYITEMSAKDHYKKALKGGKGKGFVVTTAIDRERYPNRERQGLEGPYKSRKSGKIFYYDKKAGKYYDPGSDMFLDVSDVMESFEFQFADKETAQNFMREISQKRLGSSTGTADGKVRTDGPSQAGVGSPTRAHQQMAKIMKKHGGKLLRTDEGPRMKRVFKEATVVDPITKKRVKTKPIKQKMGGPVTKDGKPFLPGKSKHRQKLGLESTELDELNRYTLKSYARKAHGDVEGIKNVLSSPKGKGPVSPKHRADLEREMRNRKKGGQKAIRKAYTSENAEQVDEVSSDTLRSYLDKSRKQNQKRVTRMADQPGHIPADKGEMKKLRKRRKGSEAAASRLDARKHNLEPKLKREDAGLD